MSDETSSPATTPESKNRRWLIWLAAAVLVAPLYFGIAYVADTFSHETTDDAFIAGHIVAVAPRISGEVAAVCVRDNDLAQSNQLLLEIDPADYAITVGQKRAAAASQDANCRTLAAAYELMLTKVSTARATARKSEADAESAEASARIARINFTRVEDLLKEKTDSQQEFDTAQAANTKAQADLKSAQESVAEDKSKVDEAQRQCDAAFEAKDMALAQLGEAQTNVEAAQLNLSYTKIFAACEGRVTRKAVEAGDYLQAGQQILSLVPETVWVVANFKESQLKLMQTNQPVMVAIEALGGREFKGHVDSVQAGSGAEFSLLPPENATGNYVKVIQRVPVKIVFDEPLPADHVIGPGLSVTPSVEVSTYVFPQWASALLAVVIVVAGACVCGGVKMR